MRVVKSDWGFWAQLVQWIWPLSRSRLIVVTDCNPNDVDIWTDGNQVTRHIAWGSSLGCEFESHFAIEGSSWEDWLRRPVSVLDGHLKEPTKSQWCLDTNKPTKPFRLRSPEIPDPPMTINELSVTSTYLAWFQLLWRPWPLVQLDLRCHSVDLDTFTYGDAIFCFLLAPFIYKIFYCPVQVLYMNTQPMQANYQYSVLATI